MGEAFTCICKPEPLPPVTETFCETYPVPDCTTFTASTNPIMIGVATVFTVKPEPVPPEVGTPVFDEG